MAESSRERVDDRRITSDALKQKSFGTSFRGFDQSEVRRYLTEAAREMGDIEDANDRLKLQLAQAERAAAKLLNLDDESVMAALGDETRRVLSTARSSAAEIRAKAEDSMARMLREAQDSAAKIRSDAEVDHALVLADAQTQAERAQQAINAEIERNRLACEGELDQARERGREMILEAQANREKVLADLARRHRIGRQQLEVLKAGRDRLLDAYRIVRQTLDHATGELAGSVDAARAAAQAVAARAPSEATAPLEMELDIDAMLAATSIPVAPDVESPKLAASGEIIDLEPAEHAGARRADAEFEATAEFEAVRIVENPVTMFRRKNSPPAFFVEAMTHGDAALSIDEMHDAASEGVPDSAPEQVSDLAPDGVIDAAPEEVPDTEGVLDAHDQPAVVDLVGDEAVADAEPTAIDEAPSVDDLFARMRATREAAVANAHDVLTMQDQRVEPPSEVSPTSADDLKIVAESIDPFTLRDQVLQPLELSMARSLKRLLSDEQNQVLDGVRRRKGKAKFDAKLLLASEHDHLDTYLSSLGPELGGAFTAAGGPPVAPDADMEVIEGQVMAEFLAPLRSRLHRSLHDANTADDGDDLTDRIRNAYREFRTSRCESAARHLAVVAYSQGAFHAISDGDRVCWLVDFSYGACSDAEDNSLATKVCKGDSFPTGHANAPAHSGCRCMVVKASN